MKLRRVRKRNKKKKGMTLERGLVGKKSFRGDGKKIKERNGVNIIKYIVYMYEVIKDTTVKQKFEGIDSSSKIC